MKTIFIILFCLPFIVYAQHDIRNADWGYTLTQVRQSEKNKLIDQKANQLMYTGVLNAKNYYIVYFFIQNKLVRVTYLYNETHVNPNKYIEEYNSLKEILTNKYSTPIYDKETWSNDLYKDRPQDIGMACSVGHVDFSSRWVSSNDATQVDLVCSGENFKINVAVFYTSIKYHKLIENETGNKNKDDF